MSDYIPVAPGGKYSYTASAAVTGGQLVEVTGNDTVGPAATGSLKVAGVAAFDAAINAQVYVYPRRALHETTADTGGVVAGNPVCAGVVAGTVRPWVSGTDGTAALLGVCTVGATATNLARWIGI